MGDKYNLSMIGDNNLEATKIQVPVPSGTHRAQDATWEELSSDFSIKNDKNFAQNLQRLK